MSEHDFKLNVLIVDDNETNRLVLTQVVEVLGGAARLAENGLEAVEAAAEQHFDLVLMDIAMPVMDGIEATLKLRANGVVCPIVAVTAQMRPNDRNALVKHGFDDLIPKPISLPLIAQAMERARQYRFAGRALAREA